MRACFQRIGRACPYLSVYTRLAHANENGIKLGNLNGQKTLRASRRVSLPLSHSLALPVSLLCPERAGRWAINQKMLVCKSNPIFDGGTNVMARGILNLATVQCRLSHSTWKLEIKYSMLLIPIPTGSKSRSTSNFPETPRACYLRSATNIGENALTERPSQKCH